MRILAHGGLTAFLLVLAVAPPNGVLLGAASQPAEKVPPTVEENTDAEDEEREPTPEERERLNARIADLIRQLGHDEWRKREAASAELLKIGRPALKALAEAAANNKDAEIVWRAKALLQQIPTVLRKKVDPKCTDGYQLVWQGVEQVQTFKAPAASLETVRVRAARTLNVPLVGLTVELRAPGEEGGKSLASATIQANWIDDKGVQRGVTRFFQWFTVEMKADKLEKGKTYELVFSSHSSKDAPWLVNCFYRDAYPDGEHRQRANGKTTTLGKFDLVFEAVSGKTSATSVPKGVDLSDKKEHYGIGHDGSVLPNTPTVPLPLQVQPFQA